MTDLTFKFLNPYKMNTLVGDLFEKSESRSKFSHLTVNELRYLLKKGENNFQEFKLKTNHPEKIVREIVAFANTNGGKLFIGVDDNGVLQGLKFADEDEFVLARAIEKYCFPPIKYKVERVLIENDKEILIFSIEKSFSKPHYVQLENENIGKAYYRVMDKSLQASKELKQIIRRENQEGIMFTFGEKEKKLMAYLSENKSISISKFCGLVNIPNWLASRTLVLLVLCKVLKIIPNEVEDAYQLAETI